MKFPSRWEQPGDAHTVLHHRPVGGLLALCCPLPPVHTAWEETPPTPSLPAMSSDLFSWHHCPLRALLWIQGAPASGRT